MPGDPLAALLAGSGLPDAITAAIRRLLDQSDLSGERGVEVCQEMIDHFHDGLARGRGPEDLLRRFGDPARTGALIRRWGRGRSPLHPDRSRGRILTWLAGAGRDLRLGLRGLRRRPTFAAFAASILALGVGAAGAIFSVVHGVLLDPLPYPRSDRLVNVWQTNPEWRDSPVPFLREMADQFPASWPILQDWDSSLTTLTAVGGYADGDLILSGDGGAERIEVHHVTAGVFEALGVPAARGRFLTRADDVAGGPPVAVVSDRLWRRRFGARTDLVGQTITLDGAPVTVIGIMPPGFGFPENRGVLWVPFPDADRRQGRGSQFITAVGRLADGVTLTAVQTELDVIAAAQAQELDSEYGARVAFRLPEVVGPVRPAIILLSLTVVVVLLIACVNLANLLLIRGSERRGEFAVRGALGANLATLRRQVVIEGGLLGLLGGVGGLALAALAIGPLREWMPDAVPRSANITLSWPVLLVSIGAGVATALLASLVPTLRLANRDLMSWIREGTRGSAGRERHRLRAAFVVVQVAAAFVLVAGAGVLGRSFASLVAINPGFPTERLLVMNIVAPEFLYPEPDDVIRFHTALRGELARIPGVVGIGSASDLPFAGGRSTRTGRVVGRDDIGEVNMMLHAIGGDYFQTMGIPLLTGRTFESSDRAGSPSVVIVNETARRELFGNDDPLGQRISFHGDGELAVVGVVADVSPGRLTEAVRPTVYLAADQFALHGRWQSYVLRGSTLAGLYTGVRRAVDAVDPGVPILWTQPMDRLVAASVAEPRFRTVLVGGLAGLAAALALVGIYGVVTYVVVQRTREIGIRMALGANGGSIVRRILGGVLVLVVAGLGIGGILVAVTFGRLDPFLFRVAPYDPIALALAAAAMVSVAVGASWLPALRASRLDPVRVLKDE